MTPNERKRVSDQARKLLAKLIKLWKVEGLSLMGAAKDDESIELFFISEGNGPYMSHLPMMTADVSEKMKSGHRPGEDCLCDEINEGKAPKPKTDAVKIVEELLRKPKADLN